MMWKEFRQKKLSELNEHIKKEKVDEQISPLIELINKNQNLVTSSSCSGRLSLLSMQESKKDASFYAKFHELPEPEEVLEKINAYTLQKTLWFRVEPFILHVIAKDIESAKSFLSICRSAGIKRGGIWSITSRVMIEIEGTDRFSLPVKRKGKLLVPAEYLELIIWESFSSLNKNKLRIEKLKAALLAH